ncbi:BtrH N-terminal domain-containing protein [Streptomyces sp. JNUCC 64]
MTVVLPGVESRGTAHCETTALGVLLRHEGLDLSEPLLFGLGAGLSFVYWDARNLDFPFLGGRVRPFELTRNLADRLGLELTVRETASVRKAWQNVTAGLAAGHPVGLQLDSHHLEYFTPRVRFGGHVVALYGYDDHRAHLVDTGPQGGAVTTSLTSLAEARSARGPLTARNRSFTLTVPGEPPSDERIAAAVTGAVTACATAFLHPPMANLGHRGVEKAARLVPTWLRRADRPEHDLPHAARMMEEAGTGGALFRNLYRDFLGECARRLDDDRLRTGHARYGEAAALWTEVPSLIAEAGTSGGEHPLVRAGALLGEAARVEREAMETLSGLGAGAT